MCVCFWNAQITIDGAEEIIVNGATTYYITEEFIPNTQHNFRIVAINGFGDGVPSQMITGRNSFSRTL